MQLSEEPRVRWYCVFTNIDDVPIEWDKLEAADIVYLTAGGLAHLPPDRVRHKVLVVFLDKLVVGRSRLRAIGRLNQYQADVFLDIPPSKLYEAEIKATRRLAGVIERGCVLPWTHNLPPPQPDDRQRRFLHFARRDSRYEGYVKGTDYLLELFDEFPHDVIGNVPVGHFLGWVSLERQLELHRQCRLLLMPSRLDSTSRVLSAAICLDQVAVLAFREAEFTLSLSFGQPPEQYLPRFFPIARDKAEYQDLVRRLMTDDDLYQAALEKQRAYKDQHRLFWDAYAIYQAFAEKGLSLPRDLTPLHLTPYYRRELLDALPAGPWSGNELSLNYV
jgi:hypothetical protein